MNRKIPGNAAIDTKLDKAMNVKEVIVKDSKNKPGKAPKLPGTRAGRSGY